MEQFPNLQSLLDKNEFGEFDLYHTTSQESLAQTHFETPLFSTRANFSQIDEEPFNVPTISSFKNVDFWATEYDQHEEKVHQIRKYSSASIDDPCALTEFKVA